MPDTIQMLWSADTIFLCLFLVLAILGGLAAYRLQRRHTMREIEAIAMQERHLYRALTEQMQAADRLRMVNHDARNELFVLQGFLERGETGQALAYVTELIDRTPPED